MKTETLREGFLAGKTIGAMVGSVDPATLMYNEEQEVAFAMKHDTTNIWLRDSRGETTECITVRTGSLMTLLRDLLEAHDGTTNRLY